MKAVAADNSADNGEKGGLPSEVTIGRVWMTTSNTMSNRKNSNRGGYKDKKKNNKQKHKPNYETIKFKACFRYRQKDPSEVSVRTHWTVSRCTHLYISRTTSDF